MFVFEHIFKSNYTYKKCKTLNPLQLADEIGLTCVIRIFLTLPQEKRNLLREDLKEELEPIKNKLDKTYNIVITVEENSEVNIYEHDKIIIDIAEIKRKIESIDGNLNFVDMATAKNWNEIAKLKSTK